MNWAVDWVPDAERELTDLWLKSADRVAVPRASHMIDLRLQEDPENQGESRTDGRRIMFETPLGVIYRVLPGEQLVQVLHVWRFD